MIEYAYEYGILDRRVHGRIVADIDRYAERAGIPPEAICRSLDEYVDPPEVEWVQDFLRQRSAPPLGLAYLGRWRDVGERMVGIAGCMVRNFIDARVMTAHVVTETRPECTLLLIPNFYAGRSAMPEWQVSQLADVLVERGTSGKSTIIHVSDLESMEAAYGTAMVDVVRRLRPLRC